MDSNSQSPVRASSSLKLVQYRPLWHFIPVYMRAHAHEAIDPVGVQTSRPTISNPENELAPCRRYSDILIRAILLTISQLRGMMEY